MKNNEKTKILIGQMTLEEKASLCSGGDFWHTQAITRLGIDRMMLTDGPHGLRRQVGDADHLGLNASVASTCFPAGVTTACSWDIDLIRKMGWHIGREARCEGVGVVLGPGINIKRNPLCGRNFEYLSEDPYLTGQLAASYIQGMQENGVAACPKHFAVNNQERLRMVIDSVVDERALREIYLLPFEYAIKKGKAKTIMTSYNKINGQYANENKQVLRDILLGEWDFKGVVVTDWGGCNDRVEGLKCGNHLEMPDNRGETDREIVQAVRSGDLSEDLLNERVTTLLDLILESNDLLLKKETYQQEVHHQVAKEVAEQSMVLLKNKDKILPLKDETRVGVIGDLARTPRYQGAGSSIINPSQLDYPLELIKDTSLNYVGYAQGYKRFKKSKAKMIEEAVTLGKAADVLILFMGLDESAEIEGLDRKDMKLPQAQIEVLKAVYQVNPNIIVVLSGGAPVEMEWDEMAKAVLNGYLGGQAGASAIFNILTGEVNPSGKLAETYPLTYEDIPSSLYYLDGEKTTEYRESIFVGYRYFDKQNIPTKYPFGFGLSYTQFEYSGLSLDKNTVSFKIKNIGKRPGAEIAQVYIGAKESHIIRPKKELKGFAKIFLEAGQEKSVKIELDDKAYAFYDTKLKDWSVESGHYEILVGSSSETILLSDTVYIEGADLAQGAKTQFPSYFKGEVKDISDLEFMELLGRPLEQKYWHPNDPITLNSSLEESMQHKGFGRLVGRLVGVGEVVTRKNVIYNSAMKTIYDMPYRALSRMTSGMLSMGMVEGMIIGINEGSIKGLKAFNKARKHRKAIEKGTRNHDQIKS